MSSSIFFGGSVLAAIIAGAIALFAPDGTLIDGVTFGPQTTDVSQGRFPDGPGTNCSVVWKLRVTSK